MRIAASSADHSKYRQSPRVRQSRRSRIRANSALGHRRKPSPQFVGVNAGADGTRLLELLGASAIDRPSNCEHRRRTRRSTTERRERFPPPARFVYPHQDASGPFAQCTGPLIGDGVVRAVPFERPADNDEVEIRDIASPAERNRARGAPLVLGLDLCRVYCITQNHSSDERAEPMLGLEIVGPEICDGLGSGGIRRYDVDR
jgi:hypothetical protein